MTTSKVIKLGTGNSPVTLAFASLFTAKSHTPGGAAKYKTAFLLDPNNKDHAATIKAVKEAARDLIKSDLDGKSPGADKMCFGNGDDKDYSGYEGKFYVSASESSRPTVVDRDRTPLAAEDGKAVSGDLVIGSITLWAQNNAYGKRINCNLRAVQFVAEGDRVGGSAPVNAESEFDSLDGDSSPADTGEDIPF